MDLACAYFQAVTEFSPKSYVKDIYILETFKVLWYPNLHVIKLNIKVEKVLKSETI